MGIAFIAAAEVKLRRPEHCGSPPGNGFPRMSMLTVPSVNHQLPAEVVFVGDRMTVFVSTESQVYQRTLESTPRDRYSCDDPNADLVDDRIDSG